MKEINLGWSYDSITRNQYLVYPHIIDGYLHAFKFGARYNSRKHFKVSCFNSKYKLCEVFSGGNVFEFIPPIKVDSSFRIEIELQ